MPPLLANPVASALLFSFLVYDPLWLAYRHQSNSAAGAWVAAHLLGQARSTMCYVGDQWAYYRREDPRVVLFDSWDEPGRYASQQPADTVIMQFSMRSSRSSLWAVTHETWWASINVPWAPIGETELAWAREQFAAKLLQRGEINATQAAALARGSIVNTRHFILGYLHNIAAFLAPFLFVLSLGWVPASIRAFRVRRARARGRCYFCGYSLAGLDGFVCPECGSAPSARP